MDNLFYILSKDLQLCGSLLLFIVFFKKIKLDDLKKIYGFGEYIPVDTLVSNELRSKPYKFNEINCYIYNIIFTRISFLYILIGCILDICGWNTSLLYSERIKWLLIGFIFCIVFASIVGVIWLILIKKKLVKKMKL